MQHLRYYFEVTLGHITTRTSPKTHESWIKSRGVLILVAVKSSRHRPSNIEFQRFRADSFRCLLYVLDVRTDVRT